MEITANVKKIDDLAEYFFVVPDYQREYVWLPEDQVEQFILDIENEYEPNHKSENSYFLGSIILVKNRSDKFDVIDGQQRLTTIILALCAFRDILIDYQKSEQLSTVAEEYLKSTKELLYKFNKETNSMQMRMELQYKDSKNFIANLIEGKPFTQEKTDSIIKMQGAYVKLLNHFKGYLREGIDSYISFLRYFQLRIELVVIESEDLGSALKIFETINQRGVGLNAMDLVKNLIFAQTEESDFNQVKDIWKDLSKQLKDCNERNPLRFLRYFLVARYYDGIIREDDLYKWIISKEGKRKINYEANPVGFAEELLSAARRYKELVLATEAYTKVSQDLPHVTYIGFINKQKSRHHLMLLMALNDTFTNQDLDYVAQQIDSYYFFANIMRVQSKYNEARFAKWAKQLRTVTNRKEIETILEATILQNLRENYSNILSSFKTRLDNDMRPLYRIRYILGRIENQVRLESGLPTESIKFYDQLQVEHILPQTPKDNHIPIEVFENYQEYWTNVHSFGNITLLESTINQAINNFNDLKGNWYEDKNDEYKNSNIFLTKMLNPNFSIGQQTGVNKFISKTDYKFSNWTKSEIEKRKNILLELAKRTWKVNGKVISPLSKEEAMDS